MRCSLVMLLMCFFFFSNVTARTKIYTLSLHDALPICTKLPTGAKRMAASNSSVGNSSEPPAHTAPSSRANCCRSEEHTSELQSRQYLVCRLLLEKKKNRYINRQISKLRIRLFYHFR